MRQTTTACLILTILLCGCRGGGQEPSTHEPGTSSPPVTPTTPDTPAPDDKAHCDPLPEEGSSCTPDQGYCVIDWGEPCGHSEALWCYDGKWEIERESNLCEDEPI